MLNTRKSILFSFVFLGIFSFVPCLTTGSKKDFDKTRNALKGLESYLSRTVSTLQGQINSINGKVKILDKDIIDMEEDFKNTHFWLGITDVYNGDWRWTYDGTKPKYQKWASGHPSSAGSANSKNNNCMFIDYNHGGKWWDQTCNYKTGYVCENNFCFS